ncbi:MAG: SDR family NAD(P)-dependent oxidoreductase [Actinobacteria bacterium]|nr:MAG: SDR family NAD(P)-dependent oxidoreductase [Actinomycetota bacterium]
MTKHLAGRTALLTGATGGIGHAIARALHRRGVQLTLTGRRTDVLEPLAQELGARALAVDLEQSAEVDRLLGEVGHIDLLIANAAVPASGPLMEYGDEQIDRAIQVNLRAPMVLARHLAETMLAQEWGHIVLISSLSGKAGSAGSSVYSATKFGLRGFGQGLRGDFHGTGVGVSVVFPGFIRDAGMFADSGVDLPGFVGTSTPEQVADGVVVAIEHDRGEVDVAPLGMKLGSRFSTIAPSVSARLQRRLGGEKIAAQLGAGQADKR